MEDKQKEVGNTYKPMIWLIVTVVLLWVINLFTGIWLKDDGGTFGDMFGAVNALFSGLAFAGLIFTIMLQRKDLALQYRTLELQLKEMKEQSDSSKETTNQLERQQQLTSYQLIQSNVNNLISIKNYVLDKYKTRLNGEVLRGTEALDGLFFSHSHNEEYLKGELDDFNIQRYIATIIYTLQFILDSDIDDKQKQTLADTLNLQTLDSEIVLIYRSISAKSQHELALLKRFGFNKRHEYLFF
ncbi:hypothetical protein ACFRAM_01395 [Paenibacillus sp. NPDC056722]|uniref:hypothetical protein n=1 Tax=Paenibacillus sp. NPDC056722 TaxID=3345924 RepID=UPI003691D2C3